jgi:exodeoxyribonuclease-3
MKIVSWNVNGLRSVYKKNFSEWLDKIGADIICLQEIKTQEEISQQKLFTPLAYQFYANYAAKKGYSGVAVLAKNKPLKIKKNLGLERFDSEGRMLYLEYSNFILINLYLPHGGRQKENLEYKLEVYKYLLNYLRKIKDKNVILSGDFNVAHKEIDLARPKQNQNNIMFTPEERKQIDAIIKLGSDGGHYTWWPYMANARQRNLGWRIERRFYS